MSSELDTSYLEILTNREAEVLKMLADGASNHDIATALYLEVSTVKWHNAQIYEKLQVRNRRQAVIRAQTLGILKAKTSNLFQQIQHNLPADTLPFIGRVQEIHELIQQLTDEKARLVTILGAGGMGKTRLSIEVGRKLLAHFSDGVYFVSLATVTSTEQMITTLAGIISLKLQGDKSPKQQLLDHLQKLHILLISDNFEHLVDSANFLSEILQYAPNAVVLVTSREKLNLAGERVHVLSGLSAPLADEKQALTDYDAVKLFVESAKRTGIEFKADDISVVAHICSLLGGMPLALLLAAAWVDTLSLAEIEAEIKAGLGIMEANLRDAPTRHQSIHAAFDVSWKRLSHHEQVVFMRLSVCQGGFTREAAQKITGANVRDLQRLVHTSFIQLLPSGRYGIHELMRQYGAEKLKASGELDALLEKHAQFFAELITPLGETSWGMASSEMLSAVNADFDNVRAAWLFQAEQKNIPQLRRFLDGIWHFLDQYSRTQEAIELFEPLLRIFVDDSDNATLFRGQLIARLGWFYNDIGQFQKAIELDKVALPIFEKFDSSNDILLIYFGTYLSTIMMDYAALEWKRYADKGYELAQNTADPKWIPPMTVAKYFDKDDEEAQRALDALPDYKFRITMTVPQLHQRGKFAEAEALMLDGMNKYHLHRIEYILWYINLVDGAKQTNDYKKAWRYVQHGLQYGDEGAYVWGTFMMLSEALALHLAEEQYVAATELLAFMLHHPANVEWIQATIADYETILKVNLSADEFEAAWERGKQLDLGDVITEYMER
jgi:predicted ATPase/DNA-binding CsgD family transcriptional regulator